MPMRAVLERLADGPQTVPQVARSLWLPRQVVQRLADAAAELGYLRFVPNPAHRRSKLAELTGTGRSRHLRRFGRPRPPADGGTLRGLGRRGADRVIGGTAHLPHMERPAEFNDVLLRFLDQYR